MQGAGRHALPEETQDLLSVQMEKATTKKIFKEHKGGFTTKLINFLPTMLSEQIITACAHCSNNWLLYSEFILMFCTIIIDIFVDAKALSGTYPLAYLYFLKV